MKHKEISTEEKFEILLKYCEKKIGYKETHDFLDKVLEVYDPISYAAELALSLIKNKK